MSRAELMLIIGDPRGPQSVTSSLPDEELSRLLDALYRHLDTSAPEPSAVFWFEAGVEECLRRERASTDSD